MRAFRFQPPWRRLPSARAVLATAALAASVALSPLQLLGQWPGEVEGRVLDSVSGRPLADAAVSLGPSASPSASATTDGSGRFLLRGVDSGVHSLLVRHPGFAPARREVEVDAGRRTSVTVALRPVPVDVEGVTARARSLPPGAHRIEPPTAAGGSAGDLLRSAPGVVVRERGEGGAETVSVRGSGPDEVLVLVDGVPLNDPVTGEADLSLLSASAVAGIVVLPGARSATWGARAQGGVILIETRGPEGGARVAVGGGSLGSLEGRVEVGGMLGDAARWGASVLRERADGSFAYLRPAEVGGGSAVRRNADVTRTAVAASMDGPLGGGTARLRVRTEAVERGLPGRSYAPSPSARQDDRRGQLAAGWSGDVGAGRLEVDVHGSLRSSRILDPAPPAGLPWDERTRAWGGGVRGRLARPLGGVALRAGVDVRAEGVRGGGLAEGAPSARLDAGILAGVEGTLRPAGTPVEGRAVVRVDRDGLEERPVPSHEISVSATPAAGLSVHVVHRSAFSPPTLADQYFRAGVGVEANPALRGERVPSEVEIGVTARGELGLVGWSGTVAAYRGDVRDMIVWAPDFRFVWSPRNVDVLRRGVDARAEARVPAAGGALTLSGSWSRASVVYDREPGGVQVRYRPRHTGHLSASWRSRSVDVGLDGRYTGTRYPVPARVNALPGFWSVDLRASTRVSLDGWALEPSLRVERLLDATDSLIFGFPHPGRTLSLRVEVATPDAARRAGPHGPADASDPPPAPGRRDRP